MVSRAAIATTLLVSSVGTFGCAAGETRAKNPLFSPHGGFSSARLRSSTPRTIETTSHAEGAAFLAALRTVSPEGALLPARRTATHRLRPRDEAEQTALILSTTERCPADMALVGNRVCVDRWEASLLEILPSGGELPWSPYIPVDGHEDSVRAISHPGMIPQGYISGRQAQQACLASGKRLCSSREWERACRGPNDYSFPYGPERRTGTCNDDIRPIHPVPEVGARLGIPANVLWRDGMNQSLINQLPGTLVTTGERTACTNDYGVYDMVGNLHEWVDDPDGTFRGGYYMDTSHNGEGCAYATTAHDFTYHDYSTGFRCCMDPEPVE